MIKIEFAAVGFGIWIIALLLLMKAIEFDKKSNTAKTCDEFSIHRKKASDYSILGVLCFFIGALCILVLAI